MSEPTFVQRLAGETLKFFEFVKNFLGEDITRRGLIKDLGGNDDLDPGTPDFPAAPLESIKAYQDAADPGADAEAAVVADILLLLDFIASNVEVWNLGDVGEGFDQLGQSLLDLTASNYVRQRFPRLFLIMQAVSAIEEATSTYGTGTNNLVRMGSAFKTIGMFLVSPGKILDDLDPGAPTPVPNDPARFRADQIVVDGILRLGTAVLGWMHGNEKKLIRIPFTDVTVFDVRLLGDLLAGWDAVGLDIDSSETPSRADVISNQMVSFSFTTDRGDNDTDIETAEPLLLSLAYVPKHRGGPHMFVAFGGHLEHETKTSEGWTLSLKLRSDAGVAMLIGDPFSFAGPADDSNFAASAGLASQPDPTTRLSYVLPRPTGSRLEIGQLTYALSLRTDGAEVLASVIDSALVIDSSDNDGFIRQLLGGSPLRLPFSLTVGYATGRGLVLEGSLPSGSPTGPGVQNSPLAGDGPVGASIIDATLPIGRRYGPITVIELALRLSLRESTPDGGTDGVSLEADTTFSAQIGPVYFRLDRLGLGLVLDASKPPAERNLRFIDARFGINPPLGIAVQVDAKLISGGGTIFHDPTQGTYFGVLALRLGKTLTLKAFGLVATRNPDGTPGSSFIIIATLEGLGLTLGPVTLDGLGLLYASDRTFDEDAVRTALPTGQLKYLLFPTDPVHHTAEILRPLQTFFPAKRGSYLLGILVKLTFGTPPIIRLDLALIAQWGESVSNRLIVLGRVSSILPTESVRIVQLNLDAVGIFDPSAGTAALDAVLVDSKLCGRFPLTGAAAFRRVPGVKGFALAVGGFHPRYPAPPGFPALPRITVALTNGDNPKLVCQAYLAITANTVQFGASASLYAAACGFSIVGHVGFDVLIQLWPPHFLAEFQASVQLKRGSTNLFKISVKGAVEGPIPLRVAGKATFEILWWDYSIGFDRTLVGGTTPNEIPLVDALAQLVAVLCDPRNWRAEAPESAALLVTVRRDDRPDQIMMHPMGTLAVQQGVVPLNLQRDIDRIGEAAPSGARRFTVTSASLGPVGQATRPVRDFFAPGQFFDLSDDDRLAAPSFEEMDAGVAFGEDGYTFAGSSVVRSPFDYTDITIGPDGTATVEPDPAPLGGPLVLVLAAFGAAALAPNRRQAARFGSPPSPEAPVLRAPGWAVGDVDTTATPGAVMTWAEAKAALRSNAVLVLSAKEQ